jgi:hypothetical protein
VDAAAFGAFGASSVGVRRFIVKVISFCQIARMKMQASALGTEQHCSQSTYEQ